MNDPLISCLMVTRGRVYPTKFAIDAFREQSYDNRELVIVCDDPDSELRGFVESLADPTIRYVLTERAILGDLRNVSIEAAKGELLCQWDDDDLYHPKRLEFQADALLKSGTAAHFLPRWTLWWPKRRIVGISARRCWEGSMLARRDKLGRYPALAREEDTHLAGELMNKHRVLITDAPDLYCYIIHGRNTCDLAHFEAIFDKASWIHSDYEAEMARLALHFPLREYEKALKDLDDGQVAPLDPTFVDRTFGGERLALDGAHFSRCTFNGTAFVYSGGPPPLFEDCSFQYVGFDFRGPAKDTFSLLRWLVDQGIIQGITRS